jgi:hypothetical protein
VPNFIPKGCRNLPLVTLTLVSADVLDHLQPPERRRDFGRAHLLQLEMKAARKTVGQNSFEQNSFGQNSFGQNSFGQNSFGQNSFGQNSFGQNSFEQNSFEQKEQLRVPRRP